MKNVLTTPEAAERLGVSPTTLKMWRYHGLGPRYIKVGRLVRYDTGELDEYVGTRTYQSTSEYPDSECN